MRREAEPTKTTACLCDSKSILSLLSQVTKYAWLEGSNFRAFEMCSCQKQRSICKELQGLNGEDGLQL